MYFSCTFLGGSQLGLNCSVSERSLKDYRAWLGWFSKLFTWFILARFINIQHMWFDCFVYFSWTLMTYPSELIGELLRALDPVAFCWPSTRIWDRDMYFLFLHLASLFFYFSFYTIISGLNFQAFFEYLWSRVLSITMMKLLSKPSIL